MSKYQKLDEAIFDSIGAGPKTFNNIYSGYVEILSRLMSSEDGKDGRDAFRYCDRRLQALRKAGKIRPTSQGWIRVKQA